MRQIQKRKADHIEVAMQEKVWPDHNHWDDVKLIQNSLARGGPGRYRYLGPIPGKEAGPAPGGHGHHRWLRQGGEDQRQPGRGLRRTADRAWGLAARGRGSRTARSQATPFSEIMTSRLRIGNIGAPQLIKQGARRPSRWTMSRRPSR